LPEYAIMGDDTNIHDAFEYLTTNIRQGWARA
jgi:hypothetical protein